MISRKLTASCMVFLALAFTTGCKTTETTKQDTPTVSEGTSSTQDTEDARTPSKLEQPDWQAPPPGMPES